MKRFFASDAESDMLIAEATKTFGLKIGDIINMAIKNQFLPITEPFRPLILLMPPAEICLPRIL